MRCNVVPSADQKADLVSISPADKRGRHAAPAIRTAAGRVTFQSPESRDVSWRMFRNPTTQSAGRITTETRRTRRKGKGNHKRHESDEGRRGLEGVKGEGGRRERTEERRRSLAFRYFVSLWFSPPFLCILRVACSPNPFFKVGSISRNKDSVPPPATRPTPMLLPHPGGVAFDGRRVPH